MKGLQDLQGLHGFYRVYNCAAVIPPNLDTGTDTAKRVLRLQHEIATQRKEAGQGGRPLPPIFSGVL